VCDRYVKCGTLHAYTIMTSFDAAVWPLSGARRAQNEASTPVAPKAPRPRPLADLRAEDPAMAPKLFP